MNNIKKGEIGENLACEWLVSKGWKIIHRNYKSKHDEIDIISIAPDKTLVFCEVKTLITREGQSPDLLKPEDNLTANKLRKISRICNSFSIRYPHLINEDKGWRIDLLAVDINEDGSLRDIRHYENI